MTKLKPGDKVCCRIKSGKIVQAYAEFDEEKDFEIVAFDSKGYFIYLPEYLNLYSTAKVTIQNSKALSINNKFIGCSIAYITDTMIVKVQSFLDGCACIKCKEFYKYAEPNQSDGTLICFNCREYPIYLSSAHDED